MKREKIKFDRERQYLSALATCKPFLALVAESADPALFPAKGRQLARLCLDYFGNFTDAPGLPLLDGLCRTWAEDEHALEADLDSLVDLVESLTDESATNPAYLAAEFQTWQTGRRFDQTVEEAKAWRANGDLDEAINSISSFRTAEKELGVELDILSAEDTDAVFAEPAESIIDWPGDAKWFFEAATCRDSLIGIQGPEKRGKTTWCEEFMFRAIASRRSVAFFEVGDLSKNQLYRRLLCRMAQLPIWPRQAVEGIQVPQSIKVTRGGDGRMTPEVERVLKKFPSELNLENAQRARRRFNRAHKIDEKRPTVKFSFHANSSINVRGMDKILRRWREQEGFAPDVVIVDYPDILAAEDERKEYRDQIDETWRALRRMSQEWNACVVCPTQAKATSYKARTMGMEHFSGNKLKNAHVNGMMGLNQTDKEKQLGVMRLNWIPLRESDFHPGQFLWVATCFPLGVALAKCCRG